MWKDRLMALLRKNAEPSSVRSSEGGSPQGVTRAHARVNGAPAGADYSRHSHGLEQFFNAIRDTMGLSLLDLGGVSQNNVTFITGMGHRLYSENMLQTLDSIFPDGAQTSPEKMQDFLDTCFNFREFDFDGALVWDSLQYLSPPVLQMAVDRLHKALRPGAPLLAYFHADDKVMSVPSHSYRIQDNHTLMLTPRGVRPVGQAFTIRSLDRLFQRYSSTKYFLTRDALREVIVWR